MNNKTIPPAQLWLGSQNATREIIENYLQTIFCAHNACHTCHVCIQIRNKQHASITWISPEKNYTLEQLEPLFHTISFTLNDNEHYFFIIEKADTLTTACANKLLKPMEEPPQGYHFILTAEYKDQVLPTIFSRCTIHTATEKNILPEDNFLVESLTSKLLSPIEFAKVLDTINPTEQESLRFLDDIFAYWIYYYKNKSTVKNQRHVEHIITLLKKAYMQLPMPGSCTFFWHNIYLQINELQVLSL